MTQISCSLLVRFVAEDDHIYHFDDSWNVTVGDFQLQNVNGEKLKVNFSFQASLTSESNGQRVQIIPHEDLPELLPYLEKLEVLLDILTLHTGTPLAIQDGSFVLHGGGYGSSSNPVTNINKLNDVSGLISRFNELTKSDKDLSNALRFFRLSQQDKDYNGKAVKLWASLEALYKGYEKGEDTICKKLDCHERKQIRDVINSQVKLSDKEKERLVNTIFMQKLSSKSTLLSKKLKLMNSNGDYTEEEISELVAWWSDARNAPSHGERIRKDDVDKQDAVDDFENTVETLLQSDISPSMYSYFIGHPDDMEGSFWDKKDSTVTQLAEDCWIKPTSWGTYLLENMGRYKKSNKRPLIYVNHDKVIELQNSQNVEILDISILPEKYQEAVQKVQKKLNKIS